MFIVTAKAPRFGWILLPALVVFLVLAVLGRNEETGTSLNADKNASRVSYLESFGWEVREEPVEALRFTMPDELIEPYRSYNEVQLGQGFDLSAYCGEDVERYTYAVTNYPGRESGCQADLYVCRGTIIAGDIVCTGENGFLAPLAFPDTEPDAE